MSDLTNPLKNNIRSLLLCRSPEGRYVVYDKGVRVVNKIGGECYRKGCADRKMTAGEAKVVWSLSSKRAKERYKRGWLYYKLLDRFGNDDIGELVDIGMRWMICAGIMKYRNYPKRANIDYDLGSADGRYEPKQKQIEGVQLIVGNDGRMLVADEPGTGKTMQAVQAMHILCDKIVFVCKAKLREEMINEIFKWTGESQNVYKVSGRSDVIQKHHRWYIISYAVLPDHVNKLGFCDGAILDESEKIKNKDTNRTKASLKLSNKVDHKLLLSGTPTPNSLDEAWTQLKFLDHWTGEKLTYREFCRMFCGAMIVSYGNKRIFEPYVDSHANIDLLKEAWSDIVLRREKDIDADVDRRWYKINVKEEWKDKENLELISLKKEYENLDGSVLVKLTKLRVISAKAKATFVCDELIKVCNLTDKKIVLFSDFKEPIDYITNRLANEGIDSGVIDGDTGDTKTKEVKRRFKKENLQVLIMTESGEHGHNIKAGDEVWFLTLSWNAKSHIQKRDRVLRIGRKRDVIERWFESDLKIDQVTVNHIKTKLNMERSLGIDASNSDIMEGREEENSHKNIAQELIDISEDEFLF